MVQIEQKKLVIKSTPPDRATIMFARQVLGIRKDKRKPCNRQCESCDHLVC